MTTTSVPATTGLTFDERVRHLMRWHFSPETGSPFWLRQLPELGFDPIEEVTDAAGLLRFPDLSDRLRTTPAGDLIPRGLTGAGFQVYESGGSSGAPKRIVDRDYRSRLLSWAFERLRAHHLPDPAHWLHLGPSGPHVFAYDCARYAALGGGLFYPVDFDPRWVKRLVAAGDTEIVGRYVRHLLDQARDVLSSQPIGVLSTTPPLIEAICADPELHELVNRRVDTIIWAGTSFSPESLRQVDEIFFPDTTVIGIYGNTLMGVAPQRPPQPGDKHRCVFEPWAEAIRIDLVEDGEPVGYGERGRVRLSLVTEEMFLPNVMERDTAVRVEPAEGGAVDGLAEVGTIATVGANRVIEGVY
ncbi:phenazine biosynthesis protein [Actinoplanes teichomyceticus]|nr:phenazine biosynthesis protein [Actinoplanes teichomyceticus]GIF16711.1 phenazine antibiotic biosynthesis protein [Actinoplanes teichomyceticus]